MLYTVGYERRDIDSFVALLQRHAVNELIDVRLTPSSRKPGFSKTRLAQALDEAEISYRHLRELGNPRENRDGFRKRQQAAFDVYREHLGNGSRDAVDEVVKAAKGSTVALLCFERDVLTCHRRIITDVAQELEPCLPVLHIE